MLELPHPELHEVARRAKESVLYQRHGQAGGVSVSYGVYTAELGLPDYALYDADGQIYVARWVVEKNELYADLAALHEATEIAEKRSGMEHGEAHCRAYVAELLAARGSLAEEELASYLRWRIGGYPEWKLPDPPRVVEELERVLAAEPVDPKGVYGVVRRHEL